MDSFILDLQQKVISPECDVITILRQACLIASKLELKDFDQWISNELNGYPNPGACPDYRKVRGNVMASASAGRWIPVSIPYMELEDSICEQKLPQSISEIKTLCKDSDGSVIAFTLPGTVKDLLNKIFNCIPRDYILQVPYSSVADIIEKVKNTILEWTLKLDKAGIRGEGMQFSDEERQISKTVPQTNNYYYGQTVVNNRSKDTQVVFGNENINFTYEKASKAISDIEEAIRQNSEIKNKDKDKALEEVSHINDKLLQKAKAQTIKKLLFGLRDFLLDIGSSVLAGLIQTKLQGLF
ncbi:MAG: ABC transporter substrate-binding protein [Aeriscardovia sp.]|nr:ABC transporter substrate-binding protein [Aeriscardovia sp.]